MIVQSCHAAIEVARNHIPASLEHPSVILCGVKTEAHLQKIQSDLTDQGITTFPFREPDRNNELTAFATSLIDEADKRLFRKYQLLQVAPGLTNGGAI